MSDPPSVAPTPTRGRLVLVSTPIGNLDDLSRRAIATLEAADVVCCEDTRHTGVMLKRLGITVGRLLSLHGHNEAERIPGLIKEMAAGRTVALVSDAGTPGVSDPGERLVAAAVAAGVTVSVVPGPSAVLAALVVSGMGLSRWRYEGFLPRRGAERRSRLSEIAAAPCPSVCFESPPRVAATLADLAAACGPDRRVAVCRELTKLHEEVFRSTLGEAAAHFATISPRGEFVLVVDGRSLSSGRVAESDEELEELRAAVRDRVARGSSRRDAVRAVSEERKLPRSLVYRAALDQSGAPVTTAGMKDDR